MATRTISASISSNANIDLSPGGYAKFAVTDDTGPVSNAEATGGSLTVSRVKVYSSAFYLAVSYGGSVLASTETCTANSGETQVEEYSLDDVDDGLLSGSPSSITLTVKKISGDKSKINFREGCTLTLEIEYEEKSSGGDSGGDDGGDDDGGDTGGDDSGGGSSGGGTSVEDSTPAENVKLSATKSYGDPVKLTWEHSKRFGQLLAMYIETEYSKDGKTWEADSMTNNVLTTARETVDDTIPLCTFAYEVSPPPVLWSYYRFRIATQYMYKRAYSEYTEPLQYVYPTLLEYTDNPIIAGTTKVKAVHMIELQTNVNTLRDAKKLPAYAFTPIISGRTPLADWSAHIAELRAAVDEMGIEHDTWIVFDINQPRADVIEQLRAALLPRDEVNTIW